MRALLAALPLLLALALPDAAHAATATTVTASISDSSVTVGGASTIKGSASGPRGRVIRLQVALDTGWRTLRSTTTNSEGRYSFSAPTSWLHRHTLRVAAPATGLYATDVTGNIGLHVTPSYSPSGSSTAWSWITTARPRYDPCRPISWKFNLNGGYAGALDDLKIAFKKLSQATGLTFTYAGSTTRVARRDEDDPNATLTVSFASPTQVPALQGDVAGQGGSTYVTHHGVAENLHGFLVLDRTARLAGGFATSGNPTWGQIMQHELAHTLGLGHSSSSSQLMYGTASGSNHRFGAGDLAGLVKVGLQPGCVPSAIRTV